MGDDQNRGSSDAFRRSQGGRKRREPPIIDATATDVSSPPADKAPVPMESPEADSVMAERLAESPAAETAGIEPVPMPSDELRRPDVNLGHDAVPPDDAVLSETAPVETMPVSEDPAEPAVAPAVHEEVSGGSAPNNGPPGPTEAMAPPTAPDEPLLTPDRQFDGPRLGAGPEPQRGSSLPKLLAGAIVLLLVVIAALIYAGPQLTGAGDLSAKVDALTQRVASLEARPEPPKPEVDVAAIDTRSKALDTDVAALKTSLADLAAKLDAVTHAASDNAAKITALEQTAAATPPAVPAPVPAPATPAPAAPEGQPAGPGVASQEPPVPQAAPAAAAADLAALSGKVDDLARRVAALPTEAPAALPAVDLAPLDGKVADLAQRVAAAQAAVGAAQAAVAAVPKVDPQAIDGRIDGLDRTLSDTGHRLSTLADAVTALPKIDLGPLQASVAELDKRLVPVEAALSAPKAGDRVTEARAEGSVEESRAAPLAVVAGAVIRALDEGRPFTAELDALHGLGLADPALGALPGLAPRGAPTAEALRDQWSAVETDVLTASVPKSGDSVLDRFAAGARNLVQVRQVGTPAGDDPSAVSARIGAALDRGDVAAAMTEWAKLPEAGRAASRGWADAARSRLDADTAAASLVSRAMTVLAKAKG